MLITGGRQAATTLFAGRLLTPNRQRLTLAEGAIVARARELAGEVWQRN